MKQDLSPVPCPLFRLKNAFFSPFLSNFAPFFGGNLINHRVVPRYQNTGEVVGFCDFEFASPYVEGLGGSAPLLFRFLGASEKMNKQPSLLLSSKKDVAITDIG